MTAIELGSVVGAALVGAGSVVAFLWKLGRRNGGDDGSLLRQLMREQTTVLQEIRDGIMALRYEVSAQRDKQATIQDSIVALHRRFDAVVGER